ncbi:GA module, partial [Anaerococcus hydrogenalis]
MKNNKKLVLGSVVALALSVGVVAPNFTKAEGAAPAKATQSVGTNDAPGKTDAQKISEAQAIAKKKLTDAGVPFDQQKEVLAYPNNVHNIEQKTDEILANQMKKNKELAKTPLGKAKLAAKAELKAAGLQSDAYNSQIDNAADPYSVEQAKEAALKDAKAKGLISTEDYVKKEADAKAKEEAAKKPLADAKAAALAELKKAGLGNSKNEFVKRVNEATTPYDVEQAKEAGLEWAKENLTTIDDWNEKEASKTRKLTIDQWLELQKKKEEKPSDDKKPKEKPKDDKKPEEKPSDGKKVTIDEWNLANAKKEAIEELKAAGITGQIYFDQINKAKTVEGVEALKAEILKAHAAKPADKDEDKKP